MFFSSQELSTSRSETSIIVQGPKTTRYDYKNFDLHTLSNLCIYGSLPYFRIFLHVIMPSHIFCLLLVDIAIKNIFFNFN
jgi:hypothetical protein